jgi:DNA-binding YbaB/EbfC family protein
MAINPFDILKNAQKIQEGITSLQDKLGDQTVTGEAGGGMASVTINGKFEVQNVTVDDMLMKDKEMLQDVVTAAFNNAIEKVRQVIQSEAQNMAGGSMSSIMSMLNSGGGGGTGNT